MKGDGAYDIPMMECAHVGVGIAGREGLAASRASDYSISQFRFLQPLIFIYKSVIFYTCQFFFQIWTGWSGTSLFEQWTLSLYNILFAAFPVLVIGAFEKDLNISKFMVCLMKKGTLISVPELYVSGQSNVHFNLPIFLRWFGFQLSNHKGWHKGSGIQQSQPLSHV